jgi:hypothetical protein
MLVSLTCFPYSLWAPLDFIRSQVMNKALFFIAEQVLIFTDVLVLTFMTWNSYCFTDPLNFLPLRLFTWSVSIQITQMCRLWTWNSAIQVGEQCYVWDKIWEDFLPSELAYWTLCWLHTVLKKYILLCPVASELCHLFTDSPILWIHF